MGSSWAGRAALPPSASITAWTTRSAHTRVVGDARATSGLLPRPPPRQHARAPVATPHSASRGTSLTGGLVCFCGNTYDFPRRACAAIAVCHGATPWRAGDAQGGLVIDLSGRETSRLRLARRYEIEVVDGEGFLAMVWLTAEDLRRPSVTPRPLTEGLPICRAAASCAWPWRSSNWRSFSAARFSRPLWAPLPPCCLALSGEGLLRPGAHRRGRELRAASRWRRLGLDAGGVGRASTGAEKVRRCHRSHTKRSTSWSLGSAPKT